MNKNWINRRLTLLGLAPTLAALVGCTGHSPFLLERTSTSNSTLQSVTLSSGLVTPVTGQSTAFQATLYSPDTSVTVAPVTASRTATVAVQGLPVAQGSSSQPIAIAVGANPVDIRVTAQNQVDQQDYTLTITRNAPTTPVLVLRFEGQNPEALARIAADMLALLQQVKPGAQVGSASH